MPMLLDQATTPRPTHASLELDVISSIRGLDALRSDWERLVDEMEVPSPFLGWDWHRLWWKHFGGRNQIRVAVLSDESGVVGVAPFYLKRYGPLQFLAPFGWPDRLTELIQPIIPGRTTEPVQALLKQWLLKEHALGLVMGLDRSAAESFRNQSLSDDVCFDWRELPSSWDQLLDGLHRSMRGNTRYYPRLLQRHGHSLEFRVADDPDSVRRALPTLYELHAARANAAIGERHRDRLGQRNRQAFLNDVAATLVPKDQMKVGILQVDGNDVAAQLFFERGSTLFLHYSGFKPEWAPYSVAMIVTSEIIQLGIERKLRRVEFLRGSKQFKTRWNTEQRIQTDSYFVREPWLLPMLQRIRLLRSKLRNRHYRRSSASTVSEGTAA